MSDIVACGELLVDFACIDTDGDGFPTLAAHPGGAPANFLAAAAAYGCKAGLLGKVGDDAFGRLLIAALKKAGIETKGIVKSPDYFTTLAFVTLDETGNREFSFARKPGADTALEFEELDLSMIDEAKVFHFGTLSFTNEPAKSATLRAIDYAKSKGKLISCDPNLRLPLWEDEQSAKAAMICALEAADIVKISDDEVKFLFDKDPKDGADYIQSRFSTKLVFVTMGAKGCYFQNRNASGFVPSPEGIKVKDTTGAGDIFGGSAVSQILKIGKEPENLSQDELVSVVKFACTAASLSTQKSGGISSVPKACEVFDFLQN